MPHATHAPTSPPRPAILPGSSAAFAPAAWKDPSRSTPPTNSRLPERLHRRHRMTAASDFAALKSQGAAFRGTHCLLVALACPGTVTRVGFVASRKGVGGAVERNRARRRLREIVRRRWSRVAANGYLLMFVAFRSTPSAPHQDLASDVERLLLAAGVMAPVADGEPEAR